MTKWLSAAMLALCLLAWWEGRWDWAWHGPGLFVGVALFVLSEIANSEEETP